MSAREPLPPLWAASSLPFQSHSATSKAAAESSRSTALVDRQRVYVFLVSRGDRGATDEEIQDALALDGSTERPRRVSLVTSKLVRDSGRKRDTRRGRGAVVWVAG